MDNVMATRDATLLQVSDLVKTELGKFLPDGVVISGVPPEILPDQEDGEYIRTTVILEDGHPQLDPRTLNMFSQHLNPLWKQRGFDRPTIAYADEGEIPA